MEAVAALGLASNVVQFLSFARELVSTNRSISRSADGSLVEHLELQAVAGNLQTLSTRLYVPPGKTNRKRLKDPAVAKEDEELRLLCEGCREVAEQLIEKINSLKVETRIPGKVGKRWVNFRQALSSVLAAEEIDDLSTRLERYQHTINTTLLVNLRAQIAAQKKQEPVDITPADDSTQWKRALNKPARNENITEQLLGFVGETKAWQADLLNALSHNNWRPDSAHDVESFGHYLATGAQTDKEASQREFHSFLKFEEFAEREETIPEAHKRTFEWAYHRGRPTQHDPVVTPEKPPQPKPQWDNFTDWLKGSQDAYWITGKPGSGKSTLMKFLSSDQRTKDAALEWSGESTMVSAGFFFWNSGTEIQMSRMGLLRSLLYQCLEGRQEYVPYLFPDRWNRHVSHIKTARPWTWTELSSALKELLAIDDAKYLFFIDGLDEFDGNPQDLVELILDLKNCAPNRIKLCVASRPWLEFEESFHGMPWLKMEDLTRQDIQLYVEENMQASSRWNEFVRIMPDEASGMIEEITDKATGVFLWVTLVVKSLLGGFRDGDNIDDLWRRIHELPVTLEELFQKILSDLNPRYFTQACELFQLAVTAFEPLTLLDMSLAHDGIEVAINAPVGQMRSNELAFRAETMRRRINSRSRGLLEAPTASVLHERAKVEYLHRTVRDFFRGEQAWAYIRSGAPNYDAPLKLATTFARHVKMTKVSSNARASTWDDFWRSLIYSIEYLRKRENGGDDEISTHLLHALDVAGTGYWSQPSTLKGRYRNYMEELVDGTTSRNTRIPWRNVADLWGTDRRDEGNMPHWVNTMHLADVGSSGTTASTYLSADLRLQMQNVRLRSFFDVAFLLQFNHYIRAVSTRAHATRYTIKNRPLLLLAIQNQDNTMANHFLDLGANPNASGDGLNGTIWAYVLQLARSAQDDTEQKRLFELAMALINHGADVSLLTDEDFDTVLADLDLMERTTLMARVEATRIKTKTKKGNHPDAAPPSASVRKAMKHRFSTVFRKKVKSSTPIAP